MKKIISLFNNKDRVGKSTLGFHLDCALGEMGKKVLPVDLDPQCNLTIHGMLEVLKAQNCLCHHIHGRE
jgi:cellulose biosynthesis protein BcsQ